jgi:cAMP phosphodiesterase
MITIFLYMVAELSALQQIVTLLTGLNGLPVVIVECAVTTIYTCEDSALTVLNWIWHS